MAISGVEIKHPVVRRLFESFETDAEAFRDTLDDEIVWYPIEANRSPQYGIDAAMQDRQDWVDTWDEHEFVIEEVIENGDNIVIALHITGRGRSSGATVDVRFFPHIRVRDGKIVYIYDHETRAEALDAAGLTG